MSEEKKKNNNILQWILEPSNNINYNFVSGMYAVGSLLSVLLYLFQQAFHVKDKENNININMDGAIDLQKSSLSESFTEMVNSLQGVYLVFLPFFPCFLWSLVVRWKWQKLEQSKQENTADKKDN